MLGRIGEHGTGTIPKDAIVELIPARNIADLMDTIVVRWGGGGDVQAGNSLIGFESYEQGREKKQGGNLNLRMGGAETPPHNYTQRLIPTNTKPRPPPDTTYP